MTIKKENKKKAAETNIVVHDKISDAANYADHITIHSSEKQILIDFCQTLPQGVLPINVARVMLHPKTAGELVAMLLEQLLKHQERFKQQVLPGSMEVIPSKKEEKH